MNDGSKGKQERHPAARLRPMASLRRVLARAVGEGEGTPGEGSLSVGFAAWILGLRWFAVVVLFGVLVVATTVYERAPQAEALRLWFLWLLLALFSAGLTALGARRLATQRALLAQIAGDVAILAALLHTAGGLHNPFAALFVLHALVAAIVLDRRRAGIALAGIAACVFALLAAEATGVLAPGCLLEASGECAAPDRLLLAASGISIATVVGGCGWIVIPLVEQLRRERNHLRHLRDELLRRVEESRAAQRSLQSEQEKLRAIVDCMTDAVVFAAPDGRVLLHNRTAARLLGAYPGSDHDLRVCHDASTWAALMAKLTDPGPQEEHPILEIAGRSYEATYARVDLDGELLGAVMLARDVTERLREEANRVERERMITAGKLAAALAHEINNPLGAIALLAEHARKKVGDHAALSRHLETIVRNADLCKNILRELLDSVRQRRPELRPVRAAELREAVRNTLEPYCRRRGIALDCHVEPDDGVLVGDPVQLRQLLVNLGLNAVEAMQPGGELAVRLLRRGQEWRFEVEDTGPGIPQARAEEIFAEFYTTKPDGTGLGLAVAREIATAHGGRIFLDSAYCGGARFVIEIPEHGRESTEQENVA